MERKGKEMRKERWRGRGEEKRGGMWALSEKISLGKRKKEKIEDRAREGDGHGAGVGGGRRQRERLAGGSGLAAIIAPGEKELNQWRGEKPIVLWCNGNCEILLRESNCMCSSSGFPLWHWRSQ